MLSAFSQSRSLVLPRAGETIELPQMSENLYRTLQQEIELGVQALNRQSGDLAVTLFQSAVRKVTVEQPLYDHLVHNLLASYKLVIERSLHAHDTSLARDFL